MKYVGKALSVLFSRTVLVSLFILAQIGALVMAISMFSDYFVYFYAFCELISIIVVLSIVNTDREPGFKIAWIIPILLFPVFGGLGYLLLGGTGLSKRVRRRLHRLEVRQCEVLDPERGRCDFSSQGEGAERLHRYMEEKVHYPAFPEEGSRYYPVGDDVTDDLLSDLRHAERYIFLEYFIIGEGELWSSILAVLQERARAGVDVRVLYDDIGCLRTLHAGYPRKLSAMGIQCRVFSRFVPRLSIRMNNRDHRKFCIVDGKTAYTGGMNLADEYINRKERFGHWKDSVVRVQGGAAWSMTVQFLTMWDYVTGGETDYLPFRPAPEKREQKDGGFALPYSDSPLDRETVAANLYIGLIARAKEYVYLTTPYLIPSESLNTALCSAAKCGIDVRIITPHIPDKKITYEATRAHYMRLLRSGVKIYEYTPGFIHAKNFVTDDTHAVVGTVNLDYRSMYLHFEDAVWFCGGSIPGAVRDDFLETLRSCEQVDIERSRRHSRGRKLLRAVLRVFSPLL